MKTFNFTFVVHPFLVWCDSIQLKYNITVISNMAVNNNINKNNLIKVPFEKIKWVQINVKWVWAINWLEY